MPSSVESRTTVSPGRSVPPGDGHAQIPRLLGRAMARRIVVLMLLATLLPTVLLAAAAQAWRSREAALQLDGRLADENQRLGSLLRQRLGAAHTMLSAFGETAASKGVAVYGGVPGVLTGVVHVSAAGTPLAGDGATWDAWEMAAAAAARRAADGGGAQMRWFHAPGAGAHPQVLLLHEASDGSSWIARVEPSYLWSLASDAQAGIVHCVTDGAGRMLSCPAPAAAGAAAGLPTVSSQLSWQAAFGGGSWVLTTRATTAAGPRIDTPILLGSVGLGGGAALLLSATVGWLQWRRSSTSLGRLVEGARRWSVQDWGARLELPPDDEFEPLAQALNRMAGRIGQQVQALQVQSAIDREILGGLDAARIMQLVAARVQALLPGTHVAVVTADGDGQNWTAHRAAQPSTPLAVSPTLPALPQGQWALAFRGVERAPAWAPSALGVSSVLLAHLCCVPVVWQQRLIAFLAIGAPAPIAPDEDVRREISELRDRVAVTLAAVERETALLYRAANDALTGLLNRTGLHDAVDLRIAKGEPFVLVLVDLDRFKEVNDTLGHQAGDELLRAVAERLRACLPPQAVLARLGGDEFVLLLPGEAEAASSAAMTVCAELARPFPLRGVQQEIGGSLGLAAFPQHADTRVELMRRADLAMYGSKAGGRGRFSWYVPAMDERAAQRAWMVHELRVAVERADFMLYFQPRVDATGGQVVCAEALLRWPHAQRGMIPPGDFVPAAEDTGLIDRLGRWVLASAMQQMARWRAEGVPLRSVAVNVSPRQLMVPGFAENVLDLLDRFQLLAADVELELTESVFVGDVDAVCRVLAPLRQAGVRLSLDDFGTGYSSLSSLYRLPVDTIKIDHSFVRDLGNRRSAEIMARSIVALAKALRKRVVAEGVETGSQRDHLLRLDCDELQGYLYGRPMPADELARRLLDSQRRAPAGSVPAS